VGGWPKPSQLAVATGKGALQLTLDEQHPPSDKAARSEATQNVFITHQILRELSKNTSRQSHVLPGANCANRGLAGTMVPEHLAETGSVLGHLVRAAPVPVRFPSAAPFFRGFARVVSLPAHFGWAGLGGSFGGQVLGHFLQPWPGHFARAVLEQLEQAPQARPVPAHPFRRPKPGIGATGPQRVAHFRSDSDQVQKRQQFHRAPTRFLPSAAKPERRRLIEWWASIDR